MPELPEVETVRRSLRPALQGRVITGVRVRDRRLRSPVPSRRLRRDVIGRAVTDVGRRAKYLLVRLEGGATVVIHLGMSGRLLLAGADRELEPHVHVVFALDDGRELRFKDPRRFGLVDVLRAGEIERDRRFRDLGVEPLSEECTASYFFERTRGLRKPIKNFLMDARHVVGVGNIYASEALFLAGVHPQRAVGRVSRATWERVTSSVKTVLDDAIRQGGTTLNDFQDSNGNAGYFQVSLRVYGKRGEPCPQCGAPLATKVLAGRSTFYCKRCQR